MVNGKVNTKRKVVHVHKEPIRNPNDNPLRLRTDPRPYSTDTCCIAMDLRARGIPMFNAPGPRVRYPHPITLRRWRRRINNFGHLFCFRANGSRPQAMFSGRDLVLLAFYRLIYPEATAAEVNAFLFNTHSRFLNPPRFYDPSQITRAEQEIGLSRKRSAQTARQAVTPRVTNWCQNYWTMPYPLGIADIPARDMIDIDEAVVNAVHARRRYGKAFVLVRARHIRPYTCDESAHIILAISGRLWMDPFDC